MAYISLVKSALPIACTSVLSGYGLFLSYQNITRLQQYEEQSEKAAEWSKTAAQRLHKTRTTQSSGTISVRPFLLLQTQADIHTQLLVSLLTPLILLSTSQASNPNALMTISAANTAILLFARNHMANFWNESVQTRVPFAQKFNDAVRGSETVVQILGALSAAWGIAGVGWGLMGRGWF